MIKQVIASFFACMVIFSIPVNVQADNGWIYPRPLNIKDTVNVNSTLWKEIWLINYDSLNSVAIDSVEASAHWINTSEMSGVSIDPLDSVYMTAEFDMSGFFDEIASGEIFIHSNGFDTTTAINCLITVTSDPAIGPIISTLPQYIYIDLEPNINGEIFIDIYNNDIIDGTGDQLLEITHIYSGAPWLTPLIDTGTVTTLNPVRFSFMVNTYGFEDVVISDIITITSNAANVPSLDVNVDVYVAQDNMGGQYHYGDINYDGWCNEADVQYLVDYLFGIVTEPCMPAADTNGDTFVNIIDVMYLIDFLRGSGPPPVNACSVISNFPLHIPEQQVYLPNSSGSRDEWVTIPVLVKNHEFYYTHISFISSDVMFDAAEIEDVTGLGLVPYVNILPSETPFLNTIVISDTLHPDMSFSFPELTHIYNLRLHVSPDAPPGMYHFSPSTYTTDRGKTMFFKSIDYTITAPMFDGFYFTIKPKISLDNISGVSNVAFADAPRNFSLSLDITSDADVSCDMHIFIQDVASENIIYADTIPQILSMGTNTYFFSTDWVATMPGKYRAGAEVLSYLDDPKDNAIGKNIRITDDIQHGLPPVEDFGSAGLGLNYSPGKPDFITDLPNLFTKNNNDDENDPEWDIDTLHSSDQNDNNCVHMPGHGILGPHDDWLIYGPLTGVVMTNPTIRFQESEEDWYSSLENRHEFYVMHKSDFDIETALEDSAILVHTPLDHDIAPDWNSATIPLPGNLEFDDTTYFAWRYVGPDNRAPGTFDIWRVDYIEFFDNQAGETYEYLPGDVNMHLGIWPPVIWGSDVTYLVNYFVGMTTSIPCSLDGFWASADINGYCDLTGGDVTRLVLYFNGSGNIEYCPDYYPAWPVPDSLPTTEPDGWPNCD